MATAAAETGAQEGAGAEPVGRSDALAATLRAAALRGADAAGGGLALVFASSPHDGPGSRPVLRAAAGFATPEEARQAASALEGWVRDIHETAEPARRAAENAPGGELAAGGWQGLPLVAGGRCWGVIAAAGPQPVEEATLATLRSLGDSAAIRLDHAYLDGLLRKTQEHIREKERREEERSDEILKLSEALFAQDIELLRSNEKLGKVERLKNDFIEKMSRELRTPLNSIIEAIISVLAGDNDSLSDLAKQNLRSALDEGTVFLRTLQNILDLWRIKQGELPIECQEVNFREVVEEAIFSVQDTLGNKPVTIEKHVKEPFPKLRTDLTKVNQLLFLLLDNAAKFTEEGRIDIHAEVVEGTLRCQITDTGIGICSDDREFVFDEFFQVDEGASAKYRGAGLGLTLVRELLALLEGDMMLESEVGRGTTALFTVPVQVIG